MTQMDIERSTAARYGVDERVFAQQVSRIEKGGVDKPPILDLLRIGEVLGLQPDDIAEMFDLWPRQTSAPEPLDPRLSAVVELARNLPFDLEEELLTQLEVIVALMRAKLRTRLHEREQEHEGEDNGEQKPPKHKK